MEKPLSQQILELIKSQVKEPDKIFSERDNASFLTYLSCIDNMPKYGDPEPLPTPSRIFQKITYDNNWKIKV